MKKLKSQINLFLTFVRVPPAEGKYELLEEHLIRIYYHILRTKGHYEPGIEVVEPASYKTIRNMISKNFDKLGYSWDVLNPLDMTDKPEIGTADAVDDLADIVKDLTESMTLENDEEFMWHIQFYFEAHMREHLINLLHYLKEKPY